MAQLVAGVDSSTQSCKVVVVDAATGDVVREGRAPHPDGTEVDPAAWWTALGTAIADAGGLDDVAAISVGGQQHGMVVLDAEGRVVRDALLWNDTRSGPAAADLAREVGAEEFARRTGVVPVASFTGAKLRWLRDAEPASMERAAAVALPHDWLSWRLRGYGPADESPLGPDLDALATDASDASGTAYFGTARGEYDAEAFATATGRRLVVAGTAAPEGDAAGPGTAGSGAGDVAPPVVVPRVVAPDRAMGSLTGPVDVAGLATAPAGLVVGPGAGDNAAAALGLGLRPGDVAVSLGTSGTVFGVTEQDVVDPTGTVAGFADASGARLPIVTTLNAARVLDVVAALLGVDHDGLAALALEAPAGSGGAVLVPWFAGERTPDLPTATATFEGLTPTSATRTHLARAAVEGMLCGLAAGVEAVATVSGRPAARLLLIGGAARSEAVQAVARTVFDAPLEVPPPAEYVARGAAVQAAWVLTGDRPDWTLADTVRLEPDPRPEVRAAYDEAAGRAAERARAAR